MWLLTPSAESITRPRVAVAVISAVAAISVGYYAYQSRQPELPELPPGVTLHRSNAVRRRRRPRRTVTGSSSSSEVAGDENEADHAETNNTATQGDGETLVDPDDEWWNETNSFPTQRAGHNIVNLLFRVSEDNARRNGCVHRGCQCNSCGMVPIRGVRYRCANCADFDLCETCEAQGVHTKTHIFYKIRVPAPPFGPRQMQAVWYTGDPDTCRRNLPRALILKLCRETGFERPELEAFWEQWTFMANTEWREDPDELQVAMDRKTFERCLVPTGGSRHAAPNLIHDRMFSFYDSNRDDLIGFTEFLHGLSYRKRKGKLLKVFEGYDIDEDGYVDRRDFLRMFRAYYVLYKQMHKDILDGLQDQLLASTEAQQLVNSRQPLSSLFGREGRVPAGDGGLRYEGKHYHHDGSVDVDTEYEHVVVKNRGDTASREDILTSLFACETDHRSRRRFITRNDNDTNWRTVRRLSGSEADRTYWVTLLEPPTTLEQLPALFDVEEDTEDDMYLDPGARPEDALDYNGETDRPRDGDEDYFHNAAPTESDIRQRIIQNARQQAPKLDKRKRDMARKALHERWKRRQFYLDEEEGGVAPGDWNDDEDTLMHLQETGESSRSAEEAAENPDDYETSDSEAWEEEGLMLPRAEQDAGKEILYQVTQQAFNELLDTIFKEAEDMAVEAAETRDERAKYKDLIDAIDLTTNDGVEGTDQELAEGSRPKKKKFEDRTLKELLEEAGFTVSPPRGRNAIEIDVTEEIIGEQESRSEEYQDTTLPQFRPSSPSGFDDESRVWYPVTNPSRAERVTSKPPPPAESEPSKIILQRWKRLNMAEATAAARGGWGKLNFEEFEAIYKRQEHQGNRLDYLGSWIDFCIP